MRSLPVPVALTERERQILRGITEGDSSREIAERLVISEHTVRAHVRNLMKKLGVSSRAQAAALAVGYLGDDGARSEVTIP
jgi:DNA-binding NarL/FixJ family response regulator